MSYRPQVKSDINGTTQDLPIDAETVQGKTPVFTTTSQTISGVKIYKDTQKFEADINIDGTTTFGPTLLKSYLNSDGTITERGTLLSNKYANKSEVDNQLSNKSDVGHSHESILDYGDTTNTIKIGYRGNGLTASQIAYIAGYSVDDPQKPTEHKIKDISKDVLKSWLGYAEVSTGVWSPGTTLTATSGYVWIVYPFDDTANTFTFSYGSGNRTGYGFAIVQGGGCIRYFQSATQLTRYSISTITFSTKMRYIKFKMDG